MENIVVKSNNTVSYAGKSYRCAIGLNGIDSSKTEGDGKMPAGVFPIRAVYYRADKIVGIRTILPTHPMAEDDAWCDDPKLPDYNTLIKLPYSGSYEKLWRQDNIYDILVVLGYNDEPPVAGKGSAIFIHLARKNYPPTEGCIALSRKDLLELLSKVKLGVNVEIQPQA